VFLEGFEYHVYNRSHIYSKLEQLFGLDPNIIPEPPPDTGQEEKARLGGIFCCCKFWFLNIFFFKMDECVVMNEYKKVSLC
jgi:hypothetical protein